MENKVWEKIDSKNLVSGAEWVDAQSSVRANIFGKMVELAKDRIKFYQGDLYHDAIWLLNTLVGPTQFDWIARESGTFIGEVCLHVKDDDWADSARYRFDLRLEGDRKWILDIYQSVPVSNLPTDIDYSENEAYQLEVENASQQSWMDRHAALDISECDKATAIEGCIFHPAPVNGWTECTGYYDDGLLKHDGDTCPSHEDLGAKYRDAMQQEIQVPDSSIDDIVKLLFEPNIPTPRNESNVIRKEMKMDDIIRDLREKFSEAESTKDQLEEYQSNINDAVDELDTYMSDLDDLINSLDSLPEVSIYVDMDTVSFDS